MRSVEPFYFGAPARQLLGCYHAPEEPARRDLAVVFTYPMGHEYIQFHRACRQLASLLAEAGFPVLRFDFYGCGDSAGASEDGRVAGWVDDINTAVRELQSRCGARSICLSGLRLGASLAALAGAERQDIAAMILWDPIASGKTYIREQMELHREMLRRAHLKIMNNAEAMELLGFALTDGLIADLESLDLLTLRRGPAHDILLLESGATLGAAPLVEHLRRLDARIAHRHLPNPQFWTWMEDFTHILVPQQILRFAVSWLSELDS